MMKRIVSIFLIFVFSAECHYADDACEWDDYDDNQVRIDENGCPHGWMYFARQKGPYCATVFAGIVDYNEAELKCQKFGGSLASVETLAERNFLTQKGGEVIKANGYSSGGIWLGARRRSECLGRKWKTKKECQRGNKNAFVWTDNNAVGFDGFTFRNGQPDYNAEKQECVYLFVGNDLNDAHGLWIAGYMDDARCTYVKNARSIGRSIRGYACGIPAQK
ncbi:unnamed protein product [Caenorhabditis bovis]|uniref:C-type lectin domain-containing protein n=1 Tax=Caenorhabditis bovis TaxID=2654633 RepID=A0A8S1EF86_9PELO|nr:unnamed protein product [Caenorhabditis bovis]